MRRTCLFTLLVSLATSSLAQSDTATVHVLRTGCDTWVTLEQLRALRMHEATVAERDGTKVTYQGAWLCDVLDASCDSTARLDKHNTLRAAVKVTAADGFVAVVALAEAVPYYSERPLLLAWSRNGQPLSERHGPFQFVPDDRKPGRNVRQVKRLEVIQP